MHRDPRDRVRHDPQDLVRDLRWAASQMHPMTTFGLFPFGPQIRVYRNVRRRPLTGHRSVRRSRRIGFGGGLLLPIALLVLFFVLSRGAGFVFFGFPFLFVLIPIFFLRMFTRMSTASMDDGYDDTGDLPEEAAEPLPAEPLPTVGDPREARLNAACDRILSALERSPETVRTFLTRPHETIETLRKTGLDLLARERELRASVEDEDVQRIESERQQLRRRIDAESDAVTRGRLESALAALENRSETFAAIRRNANRLEAEQTRLVYTLEGLHAQVLRVRGAGTSRDPAQAEALRQTVATLRDEVGALADAIEEVEQGPGSPVVPIRARDDRHV